MSADISKMFREVCLAESDRDLHRFLHENSYGEILDWRLCHVTYGITSSPFPASQVLLQTAEDHKDQYPDAAAIVQKSFYVDDCLTGADDLDVAKQLRSDLMTCYLYLALILESGGPILQSCLQLYHQI